jgi:VWFA-related protein
MSTITRRCSLLLSSLTILLAAGGLTAQEAAASAEEDSGYFEEIAVDIVNVEVYVTDNDDNPVQDLTVDDFSVMEDGRPVEVMNFYAVSKGRPTSLEEPVDEGPVDPLAEPETEVDELTYPTEQRLNLIIYVDNLFIHPLNRNRVFSRLRGFLYDTLRPGDQVMVASYDRSLHIRHPFTIDIDNVSLALDETEKLTGYAQTRELERSEAVQKIYETRSLHKALFEASSFADATRHHAEESLDGLREMLESLAGLPGRKMLIHLSDGLPAVPGQDLYQAVQQNFADQSALAEAMSYDLSQRYVHLIAEANSNRVSFYTIDAAGLRTQSGIGAETRAIASPTPVSSAVDSIRTSNLQDTLITMADKTGGQAIFNTNDVSEGLRRVTQDFNNYYSLGYRAPMSDRGRYHDIEVRLLNKQKGWKIRHREGYRDKPVAAQMEDAVNAFFVHGYQVNPHTASVDLGPQTRDSDGNYDVAIRVRIPIEKITFVPRPGIQEAQLSLYFSAIDEKGSQAAVSEMPLELRIPDESMEVAMQDEVGRVINLTMKPGPHKFVVGIRDEISEVRSILGRYVMVGEGGPENPLQ